MWTMIAPSLCDKAYLDRPMFAHVLADWVVPSPAPTDALVDWDWNAPSPSPVEALPVPAPMDVVFPLPKGSALACVRDAATRVLAQGQVFEVGEFRELLETLQKQCDHDRHLAERDLVWSIYLGHLNALFAFTVFMTLMCTVRVRKYTNKNCQTDDIEACSKAV